MLINITSAILGNFGTVLLAIIVGFACITTSIGLTSVTSKYFEDLTNKKLKYEYIVICICTFSALVSNLGVDKIIQIAIPILNLIYTVSMVLVIMNIFKNIFTKDITLKGTAYSTIIDSFGINIDIIHKLLFSSLGFNWLIPAILGGLIATLLFNDKKSDK